MENLILTSRPSITNTALFKRSDIHSGSGPLGPIQFASVCTIWPITIRPSKITPWKSVLNNTHLYDSALYKSGLDDSALGNLVGINVFQDSSPQALEGVWYVGWGWVAKPRYWQAYWGHWSPHVVFRLFLGRLAHAASTACSYAYIECKELVTLKFVQSTEKYQ